MLKLSYLPSSNKICSTSGPDSDRMDKKYEEFSVKVLVIYDSKFGNTEKIAAAIGESTGGVVCKVADVAMESLGEYQLLIIGSPTHGGFPSENMHALLKRKLVLKGITTAAFDTRTRTTVFGYAAPKIARDLQKCGGSLIAPPEGFFVLGMQGPLKVGELERATQWSKQIINQANQDRENTE
jgi:flavodoxin I